MFILIKGRKNVMGIMQSRHRKMIKVIQPTKGKVLDLRKLVATFIMLVMFVFNDISYENLAINCVW